MRSHAKWFTGGAGHLLLLALLVSACNTGDAPEPNIPPSPPASEPVTESASAPVTSEGISPDTPLTAFGWGPLRVGMTVDEVIAAAGEDANPEAVGGPDPATCDEFRPARAPAGLLVMIENGRLSRVSIGSGSPLRTDRGLGIGDDAAAVREAYGEEVESTPHAYVAAPGEYLTVLATEAGADDIRGIVYEIGPEGRISRIHSGGPAIRYAEGCL